jgi:hypothetical protein
VDKLAKAASRLPTGLSILWPDGEMDYSLLHRGAALRSDPRRHIKASFARAHDAHLRTLQGGLVARLVDERPCPVSKSALKALRSTVSLAKHGGLHLFLRYCPPMPVSPHPLQDEI